jgi:hypothetical protein
MKSFIRNRIRSRWYIVLALTALLGCSKNKTEPLPRSSDEVLQKEKSGQRVQSSPPPIQTARVASLEVSLPPELMSLPSEKIIESAHQHVQAALTQGIADLSSENPEIRVRILELWKSFVPEFQNKPIPGASAEVLAGLKLPSEITELLASNANFAELLKANKVPFLSSDQELYQAATIYTMARIVGSFAGDEMTVLLRDRANQPTSVGDLVAYFSISDSIREIGGGTTRYPIIEDLQLEATARNPVYRLLALQAITVALPRGVTQPAVEGDDKGLAIYHIRTMALKNFANDTDPTIISRLIEILSVIPDDEAKQTVNALRERNVAKLRL